MPQGAMKMPQGTMKIPQGDAQLGDKLMAAIGRYKPKRPLYSKPIGVGKKRGAPTLMMRALGQLQGLQLRFFKSLLTSSKVPAVMRAIRDALEKDCCVVVGLQSTGGESGAPGRREGKHTVLRH